MILDPEGVEEGGTIHGMGLLKVVTILKKDKVQCQVNGSINEMGGIFTNLSGLSYNGYEIHMGNTYYSSDKDNENEIQTPIIKSLDNDNVYGTYVHGIFDKSEIALRIINTLARNKGIVIDNGEFEDYQSFKEKQYDKLADTLRKYLNMEEIYGMLKEAHVE